MKRQRTKVKLGECAIAVCHVGLLLLLSLSLVGCGKSDETSRDASGKESEVDSGRKSLGGACSAVTGKKAAPANTLVVKGLYVGMPGDDAVEACQEMVASSKDLVVADFRNGIEREKDAATKSKENKAYEDNVKLAEADVERFLEWNDLHGATYDPSQVQCRRSHSKGAWPSLNKGHGKVAIGGVSIGLSMAALAGIHGYQVEWMIPAKRNNQNENGHRKQNFTIIGKFELPKGKSIYHYCKELVEKTVITDLYGKGLRIPKEHKDRIFARLVLQDANGNPIEKGQLATELVLNCPESFKSLGSKQEKLNVAKKEVDLFLEWLELGNVKKFDPSDTRTETAKRKDRYAEFVKERKDMQKNEEEIKGMEAKMYKMKNRASDLNRKIADLKAAINRIANTNPRGATARDKYKALKEELNTVKEKKNRQVAEIKDIEQRIEKEKKELKMKKIEMINIDNDTKENGKAADGTLLKAALKGDASKFRNAMDCMASKCKAMVEWGVVTESTDKIEEIIEVVSIQGNTAEEAIKFAGKLDTNLGQWSHGNTASDGSRKRLLFEKDMTDLMSPLWFRLVLKTTNGVEVTKTDVVKNWLVDRGHYPPSDKLKIAKKNLIQISLKKEGVREDQLKGLCFVWIDGQGNVKEAYFNEDGIDRLFNAGDLSGKEFAQALVNNYSAILNFKSESAIDNLKQYGHIETTSWIYKDPKGYQVKLFERAYVNRNGRRYTSDKKLFNSNAEVSYYLSMANKAPQKFLSISTIKPESARKFD